MKYFGILTTLLLYSWLLFPKSAPRDEKHIIDSLNIILQNNNHDTTLANAYLALSEMLVAENIDTLKFLCEKSKEIAEKNLKNNKLSLKEKTSFKIILSKSLGNIGYYYGEVGEIEKQKHLYLQSLKLIKETKSKIDIAATLNNVGYLYGQLGEVEKQKQYYIESLELKKEIGDKDGTALSLFNLGLLYFNQGDIPLALDHLYKALKIQEVINKKEDVASTLSSLGYIYGQQGKIEKQKEFYLKSLAISEEINDKHGIVLSYNNIGAIYKTQGDNEKALKYFYACLKLSKEIKLLRGISNSLNNIGNIYEAKNDFNSALKNYQESLIVREDLNDNPGIINSLLSIGGILHKQGKIKEANIYSKKALIIAKEIGYPDEIKLSANLLQKTYKEMGNYKDGWEAYELFISMQDSVNNIETQKATIEQNLQYEFDKKETLASIEHQKELTIKEAEKQQQKIIIWAGAIVLILIVGFSVFIANRLKLSNKQKLLIEQKNKENELLLGEIHHRVKNNLQVISSLLGLQERSINDVATKSAIAEGKERVKSMGLIHKMLYQNDNYSGVEMDNYGRELIKGLVDSFGMKDTEIDINLNFSQLKLDVDTAIPIGLIINELVINTLKYAFEKTNSPAIKVSLIKQSENLILEVSDNGTGKISDLENSKSFGMKLIKSLSRQIGGTVSINDVSGICVRINISDYKLI